MEVETTSRRVRSVAALERLLDRIDAGELPRPDWLDLQGAARIDKLPAARRGDLVGRIHRCVLRGFRCTPPRLGRKRRLALWREVTAHGFHDFSEFGWQKCFDSPFVEDYDYVRAYLEGGIEALDPYRVYSSVLGTFDFGVEDFVHTELCRNVRTIVEPMAGSAEFAYHGHFRHPDFQYVMLDLDADARQHVLERSWLADTERHYLVEDVLDESGWQKVKSLTSGESLAYLGKQSHHFFGARDLLRLMKVATEHVDYFMLEVPPPTLVSDLPEEDELTRPEMEDAGFRVALVDDAGLRPNPLTNRMGFRLDVWDRTARRTLFRYGGWTFWQPSTLVALADLLDLRVTYFHGEETEFFPVDEPSETADLDENISFLVFTRHKV